MTELAFKLILSYLMGSVSGSILMGALKKVDIRTMGSGNAGGTNAFRTQGLLFALGVIVIDVGKAIVAAAWVPGIALISGPGILSFEQTTLACGFAVVLGHCYPVYHGFKGGKGAATAAGALMIIEPVLLVTMLLTWLVVLGLSGYVGLATVLAGISLVPSALYFGSSDGLLVFSIAIAAFMAFTHRSNLKRLKDGNENRFEKARVFNWFRK